MTLIELKDDEVISVLPLFRQEFAEFRGDYDVFFTVIIKFKDSSRFRYHTERSHLNEDLDDYLDEEAISDTIHYLFSDTSKFKDLTAEEFKENLKKYLDSL